MPLRLSLCLSLCVCVSFVRSILLVLLLAVLYGSCVVLVLVLVLLFLLFRYLYAPLAVMEFFDLRRGVWPFLAIPNCRIGASPCSLLPSNDNDSFISPVMNSWRCSGEPMVL